MNAAHMMTMTSSPAAEVARESARAHDGKFGTQPKSESDVDLFDSEGAWTPSEGIRDLRFGGVYTETGGDGITRQHADLTDEALAQRIADFQTEHGLDVRPEQVRVRTAMDTGAGRALNLRVQVSLDDGNTWEDELHAEGTPVAAAVSDMLAGYDRAAGYPVPWRRDEEVLAPQRANIFDTAAGAGDRANNFAWTVSAHRGVTLEAQEEEYRSSLSAMADAVDVDTVDVVGLNRLVATHYEQIRAEVAGKADSESVCRREGAAAAMSQVLERGDLKSPGRRIVLAHQLALALAQDKELSHALAASSGPVSEHRLGTIYNSRFAD